MIGRISFPIRYLPVAEELENWYYVAPPSSTAVLTRDQVKFGKSTSRSTQDQKPEKDDKTESSTQQSEDDLVGKLGSVRIKILYTV